MILKELGVDLVRVEEVCTAPSVLSNVAMNAGDSEIGAPNKLFRLVALAGVSNVKLRDKISNRLDASFRLAASVV